MTRKSIVQQMARHRRRVVTEALKSGNVSRTAAYYRITRQTLHRWIARYDGTLESLKDRSKRPRSHPNEHSAKEIEQVTNYFQRNRKLGMTCLWIRLKQNGGYTRSHSALYRILRKRNLIEPPKRRQSHKSKPYEPILVPGERFQVDVKHVPSGCLVGHLAGQRMYQFTAIDECTRWRYAAIHNELSTFNAVRFVKNLQQRFPFEIACIQTDNGSEFTSRLQGAKEPSAFEAYLAQEGIRHKTIAVATPRHNGKVERSHRSDQERFYEGNTFFSIKHINDQFKRYLNQSNRQPLSAHNWKSAHQKLTEYAHAL